MTDRKVRCAFANGSTNLATKKAELPTFCKERNCSGVFRDSLPICENFILPISGRERLQSVKALYEFSKERISISAAEFNLKEFLECGDPEVVCMAARALFRHYNNLNDEKGKKSLLSNKDPDVRKGIREEIKIFLGN